MLAITERERDWYLPRYLLDHPEPDRRREGSSDVVTTASTDKPQLGEDRKALSEHMTALLLRINVWAGDLDLEHMTVFICKHVLLITQVMKAASDPQKLRM